MRTEFLFKTIPVTFPALSNETGCEPWLQYLQGTMARYYGLAHMPTPPAILHIDIMI